LARAYFSFEAASMGFWVSSSSQGYGVSSSRSKIDFSDNLGFPDLEN
jgi:hypothetical protein